MATLIENANRIATGKENIRQAIIRKGVDVTTDVSLDDYDSKIDEIDTGTKIYSKYVDITAGTWTGATLSDTEWVALCNANYNSHWTYYFEKEIDITKIKYISASMIESERGIRITRGYASNSTTLQYQFIPSINLFGNIAVPANSGGSEHYYGGITIGTGQATISSYLDNYGGGSSNEQKAEVHVWVRPDSIVFQFAHMGRALGHIRTTTPKFSFVIGYTD